MKIVFSNYADIDRLQQLCIFAQHDAADIDRMAQSVRPEYADKMRKENAEWFAMRQKLAQAVPGVEVTI